MCPIGNPISHSTHVGFSAPLTELTTCESISCFPRASRFCTAPLRKHPRSRVSDAWGVGQNFTAAGSPLRGSFAMLPRFSASLARGVGHSLTAFERRICTLAPVFLLIKVLPRNSTLDGFGSRPAAVSGVGHNPDSVASVMGAKGGSWYAVPLRIIPDRGQVSEYTVQPSTKQRCDVLHDDISESKLASKARSISGETNVLTWEPTADDINGNSIGSKAFCGKLADVGVAGNIWPVLCEDSTGEVLDFAEGDGFESACSFEAKTKSSNAAEKIKDAQLAHHPITLASNPRRGCFMGRIGPRARSRIHCDVPVLTDVALWAVCDSLP